MHYFRNDFGLLEMHALPYRIFAAVYNSHNTLEIIYSSLYNLFKKILNKSTKIDQLSL